MKRRNIQRESYAPVEKWDEAPASYSRLKLDNGEFTVIADPRTGAGMYLVARVNKTLRYCAYIDGNRVVKGFQEVSLKY